MRGRRVTAQEIAPVGAKETEMRRPADEFTKGMVVGWWIGWASSAAFFVWLAWHWFR